jgi:hypothetical protein
MSARVCRTIAALLGVAALAGCSVKGVTFTPEDNGQVPSEAGVDSAGPADSAEPIDSAPMIDGRINGPALATLTVRGDGMGMVIGEGISCGALCSTTVEVGTTVTLRAMPDPGSVFASWSGEGCAGGEPSCALVVTRDVTIAAQFALARRLLTVHLGGSGGGLVQSAPAGIDCGAACSALFDAGQTVTLHHAEAPGSVFGGWQGGGCTGLGDCDVQMSSAQQVTAIFSPPPGLFMVNQTTLRLERLNPLTLVVTDVGPLGISYNLGDCAWNPADATLYLVDGAVAGRSLYRVNLTTGAATLIGVHGIPNMLALAYHPPTNQLYGIATAQPSLYKINTATGEATPVDTMGGMQVEGLAWDSKRNVMIACTVDGVFHAVDLSTGVLTRLQGGLFGANLGMTYDPGIDRFWAAENSSVISQFDPTNSFARTVVASPPGARTCMALVPAPLP